MKLTFTDTETNVTFGIIAGNEVYTDTASVDWADIPKENQEEIWTLLESLRERCKSLERKLSLT